MTVSKVQFNSEYNQFELQVAIPAERHMPNSPITWSIVHTWTLAEFNSFCDTIEPATEEQFQYEARMGDSSDDRRCCLCGRIQQARWALGGFLGYGDNIKIVCQPCAYTDKYRQLKALQVRTK